MLLALTSHGAPLPLPSSPPYPYPPHPLTLLTPHPLTLLTPSPQYLLLAIQNHLRLSLQGSLPVCLSGNTHGSWFYHSQTMPRVLWLYNTQSWPVVSFPCSTESGNEVQMMLYIDMFTFSHPQSFPPTPPPTDLLCRFIEASLKSVHITSEIGNNTLSLVWGQG